MLIRDPGFRSAAAIRARCLTALAAVVASTLLAGCSMLDAVPIPGMDYIAGEEGLLRDRQGDYLEAQVLPPTRIPD